MITHYIHVVAMDIHGAVQTSSRRIGESEDPHFNLGKFSPLGNMPVAEDEIVKFAREHQRRLGRGVSELERLADVTHEGVTFHPFFATMDRSMIGSEGGWNHRWYVESMLDYLPPSSMQVWDQIRDRPFTQFGAPADSYAAERLPRVERRRGQSRALSERLFPYANAHADKGVVIVVRDKVAILVDGAGNELGSPHPVNVDTLCPELRVPTDTGASA